MSPLRLTGPSRLQEQNLPRRQCALMQFAFPCIHFHGSPLVFLALVGGRKKGGVGVHVSGSGSFAGN